MKAHSRAQIVISRIFAVIIFTLGILNFIYVDPRPGIIYVLASLLFVPTFNDFSLQKFKFSIPFSVKVILFVMIVWFTMGVSDLGEVLGF